MSAYTPGPWKIEQRDADEFWFASGYYAILTGKQTIPIGRSSPNAQATAALVAAAPDLLAALTALEQAYTNKHSPQHRASCLIEARAAIARAEGRA